MENTARSGATHGEPGYVSECGPWPVLSYRSHESTHFTVLENLRPGQEQGPKSRAVRVVAVVVQMLLLGKSVGAVTDLNVCV